MEVAIISSASDLHSEVVRWSMEQAGIGCHVLDTLCGVHNHRDTSLLIDDQQVSPGSFLNENVRSAWYRRHYKVRSSTAEHGDENTAFRTSESNIMQENVVATLSISPDLGWINNPRNARFAENKFLQLAHARKSGLTVPATLMSADPERIRDFARSRETVVVKPFGVYAWEYSDRSRTFALASKVASQRIIGSSDSALSNTPAIYQSAVEKITDLRVVVIGQDVYAYNILQTGDPDFDCRFAMANPEMASIEQHDLSGTQKAHILHMMKTLDINMASADFALTADGDIVFLDLNPAGAWLFLEERVPAISLTRQVCRLLAVQAGMENLPDFPDFAAFSASSAIEAFHQHCRRNAEKGVTIRNDRTWTQAA